LGEDWKHYFETRHEGLGTTYERFVLHAYFRRIRNLYGIRTVLEAPAFGMTGISGINSVWWARHGAEVTLVDQNRERLNLIKRVWHELSLKAHVVYDPGTYSSLPFDNGAFDLSWNFAALNLGFKPEFVLRELTRVTRKVIFVCLPNRLSLFTPIGKLLLGDRSLSKDRKLASVDLEAFMKASGWNLREKGFFDAPPWPDIAMSKEDLFRRIGLKRYAKDLEKGITEGQGICILDYYSGRNKKMEQEMGRYGFLENSPGWVKTIWAHHRYFVFSPRHPL